MPIAPDPEPPPPELGFGRVSYSDSRRPRSQRAGRRPLPRNCPVRCEHWRREKQLSIEDMTTLLVQSWCVPRLDPYSTLGTATSAGQKSSSHTRPGRVASIIVSFAHAPETTGVCIHGPAPFIHPSSALPSSCRQWSLSNPCKVTRAGVSSVCTNPQSHSFFRYQCPLFWLLYPRPRPSLASAAVILISLRQVAPPLLSGRIILEKPQARGLHL